MANPKTGWGLRGETWQFMDALEQLGGETWFRLGDRDIATHIERTRLLQSGETLSEVTARFAGRLGLRHRILPATDDPLRTFVETTEGPLPFQEYFVKRQCAPVATGFEFRGAAQATPSPEISRAFESGDVEGIILCPSNPYVSIAPIMAIAAIGEFVTRSKVPVIAVSPIVGGRAIKGPAAKIMTELGATPSATSIAAHYRDLVTGLVIDTADATEADAIRALGIDVAVTGTVMNTGRDKATLARDVLEFAQTLRRPA